MKAVIFKGNPEYVWGNPIAYQFYANLKHFLLELGVDTVFGDKMSLEKYHDHDLWIGHSEGCNYLESAPKKAKKIEVDNFQRWNEETGLEEVPPNEHYELTNKLKREVRKNVG